MAAAQTKGHEEDDKHTGMYVILYINSTGTHVGESTETWDPFG